MRVYYYNAPLNQETNQMDYKKQQAFFSRVRRLPYFEVKLGRLKKIPGASPIEKGVDVRLAVDMVSMGLKSQYDVAVLVSGDGDFSEAVQIVKDAGKHVELAYPKGGYPARQLQDVCDIVVEMEKGKHLIFL